MSDRTRDTLKIPDDLREDYDHYRKYMKCASRSDVLIERIARLEEALKTARKDAIRECIDEIVDEDESTFQGLIDVIRENLRTLIDQPTNNHP